MITVILFGLFFVLILVSVPIAISLGITSIVTLFLIDGTRGLTLIGNIMYTSISKFTLLAIPFFILAGVIMEYSGISRRLINFAQSLVGHYKSGIVFVTVFVAVFFAAISGSGPATVAAIGSILIPALVKNGYTKETASSLVASSGSVGIIIPPSIAFIVFAVVAGDQISVTIGRLFIAGIVPGILIAVALIVTTLIVRRKNDLKGITTHILERKERDSLSDMAKSFFSAFWGLMIPIIILGGIYSGLFTPTEAAVVAVFYGLFVGMFIYRELTVKKLYRVLVEASVQTAIIMLIVSSASFAHIITSERIARDIANSLLAITENPIIILLIINLILLVAGAFIDAISAFYIFVPIILPVMLFIGVDPTVIGVVMTVNLAIGLFTPPVGLNLYVASGISGVSLASLSKSIIPYLIASIIVLLLITYIPSLSTFLPDLLGVD